MTKEEARARLADAEVEFRRGLVALRLDVPDAVWGDINLRFATYREAAWDAHNRERDTGPEAVTPPNQAGDHTEK